MLSLTYTASHPSNIMKELTDAQAQLFRTHVWQGYTTYSSGENSSSSRRQERRWAIVKMTTDEWVEVAELQSRQEEAGTRLLLHALHAAGTGSKAVIVTAEDTDVMLRCLTFQKDIPCHIYQKCGTQNRTRFVDISKLALSLGDSVCDSLIGLHAFTGCDTVSAFANRGKLSALKLMQRDITYQETCGQVGQSWDVQPKLFEKVKQFTCRMYVAASRTTEVNDLRYQLFCAKRGEIESNLLPPCRDCLFMHLLRANCQAAI